MSLFMVTWSAVLDAGGGRTPEQLLDDVMDHLLADGDAIDPSISYDRGARTAAIELTVDATDPLACVQTAAAVVRRATVASGLVTTLLPASGEAVPTAVPGGTGSALRFGRGPELVAV